MDLDPSEFELTQISSASDSDDNGGTRSIGSGGSAHLRDAGVSSGTVTPKVGLGLSGLTARNESRERLTRVDSRDRLDPGSAAGSTRGGGSRTGSPTRWKTPLMSPVKEV